MIFVGADHGGWALGQKLVALLCQRGLVVESLLPERRDAKDDYPLIARQLARRVSGSPVHRGIALCRTGVGMALAANKVAGIRAVAAQEVWQVKGARADEDANILSLAADHLTLSLATRLIDAFLTTPSARLPRYQRRLREIRQLDRRGR